jgi:hypothetical protein
MPEISRFYGIVVRLFFNDHEPPRFHAIYGEYEALVEIERWPSTGAIFHTKRWRWCWNGQLWGEVIYGADLCPDVVIWGGPPPADCLPREKTAA